MLYLWVGKLVVISPVTLSRQLFIYIKDPGQKFLWSGQPPVRSSEMK